ncbi:MAG TPA: diacylglycerol kinase [Gemmataceae bacterium]|nr:diacylglycerol kinase [Gemmataceae bacterium]
MTVRSPSTQHSFKHIESPGPVQQGDPWREKLRQSLRGLKLGIRGHSSFFVHFFFAALVLAAGMVLRCQAVEWCLLAGGLAMVFITELCASSVKTIHQSLEPGTQIRARPALEMMAGAVFIARLAAALIGALVLLSRWLSLLSLSSS